MMNAKARCALVAGLAALVCLAAPDLVLAVGEQAGEYAAESQPGQGFGLVRALILGIFLVVVFRFLRRRGQGPKPPRPGQDMDWDRDRDMGRNGGQEPRGDKNGGEEVTRREVVDRYTRAQQAWDMFSDQPAENGGPRPAAPPPNAPSGFDREEFLEGAKAMYARLRKSCDERNYDDIAQFTTTAGFEAMKRRADNARPGAAAFILFLEADLGEMNTENGRDTATVRYQATLADQDGTQREVRETWVFTREADNPDSHWRLDSAALVS